MRERGAVVFLAIWRKQLRAASVVAYVGGNCLLRVDA